MSLQAARTTVPGEPPGLSSASAMRTKPEEEGEGEGEGENMWDCGSPLYDSYELASLSHLLDRNTMALSVSSPESDLSTSSANGNLRSAAKPEALCKQRLSAKSPGKNVWKKMRGRNGVAGMLRSGFSAFARSVMKK